VPADQAAQAAVHTAREHGISHVLPIEYGTAGRAAARLLADPAGVRRLLDESERPLVWSRQAGSVTEVAALLRRFGFPAVVRSTTGTGPGRTAAPTVLLNDRDALDQWARTAQQGPWLVEEFLPGPEVVVSTLTVDGMHQVVGVTAKEHADDLTPIAYLHPAALSEHDHAAVAATVTGLLDLADYEFGPAQTNVVLTRRGPCVVASRTWFGKHKIPRLIELTSGFDPETELLRAVNGELFAPPTTNRCAALGFLSLRGGSSASATGSAAVTALPGVCELNLPSPPDQRVRTETCGFVVVCGESPAQVTGRLERVRLLLDA
jgi:hypothetical protein